MIDASDPLLHAWQATLARGAAAPALLDPSGRTQRTFAEIAAEAAGLAAGALRDFPPGAVVALQLGNRPAWPAWLLACWRRRLVVLPLERSMAELEREAALQICHAAALVTDGLQASVAGRNAEPVDWAGPPPALLKLTSGTTATPRAIRFRTGQLLADCTQICNAMGITDRDLNFGVIPVSHSYGFSSLLTPLLARGVPLVLSEDRMPRAVLEDLRRSRATVFAGMPVFYQALVEMEAPPVPPELRLCISAGAPLALPVAQKFRARFGLAIHSFYGSSECGGICYDRAASHDEQGFVGTPLAGVKLELLEPEATMSRVRVHSAAAGDGYFPIPQAEKLGGGSFVPDDLLVATPEGFRIAGRASEVINVAGKKVSPAEVETILLRFAGVREAVVFGRASVLRNEEVAACVVAEAAVTETALREFCRGRLSGWQVPKRIFFLEEMPVTERGKINRRQLAERFAS
ncbi:MAG: class I adenylate-forming enzyme family protein [Chthoniobacterales bacterium]